MNGMICVYRRPYNTARIYGGGAVVDGCPLCLNAGDTYSIRTLSIDKHCGNAVIRNGGADNNYAMKFNHHSIHVLTITAPDDSQMLMHRINAATGIQTPSNLTDADLPPVNAVVTVRGHWSYTGPVTPVQSAGTFNPRLLDSSTDCMIVCFAPAIIGSSSLRPLMNFGDSASSTVTDIGKFKEVVAGIATSKLCGGSNTTYLFNPYTGDLSGSQNYGIFMQWLDGTNDHNYYVVPIHAVANNEFFECPMDLRYKTTSGANYDTCMVVWWFLYNGSGNDLAPFVLHDLVVETDTWVD